MTATIAQRMHSAQMCQVHLTARVIQGSKVTRPQAAQVSCALMKVNE